MTPICLRFFVKLDSFKYVPIDSYFLRATDCESRNMIGQFMKTYLHRPIAILHFPTQGRIEKCFTDHRNILAFLSRAYNKRFSHMIILLSLSVLSKSRSYFL